MLTIFAGVTRFHEVAIRDDDGEEGLSSSSESKLEQYIKNVRDSLGVQLQTTNSSRLVFIAQQQMLVSFPTCLPTVWLTLVH